MAPNPRSRPQGGPAILSFGFRPFFFFGALYSGAAILLWLAMFDGQLAVASAFAPRDWHVHEMLFGYVGAVVTGFLLTAIPNWTGRLPLQGMPLLALVAAWAAGRFAVAFSIEIGWAIAAAIDGIFLFAVAAAAAREIAASRNFRNLRVVAVVTVLAGANLGFHVEAHVEGAAEYSMRAAFAASVLLIVLIGGRIVPSFTLNWLSRQSPGRLPAPFGRFDGAAVAVSAAALVLWIAWGDGRAVGAALLFAGALQAVRLARWAGYRTGGERLLLVLHAAYAFVPLGFVLLGSAALGWLPPSAGLHAWGAGAIGTMTIAVMSRASLGHTGRPLTARPSLQFVYAAVLAAAAVRIAAALDPETGWWLLWPAALTWGVGFIGFACLFAPILWRRRAAAAR
ncbi:MAG: NnrS family protein [Rhodospirillaceae bacterium]|nr:NnrS family protein [Rhodospirillaceae bacterium]